jgi:transcription termination factor Rho
MSVLDRAALQASPLADLHVIASELGLDGYRRLRKAEVIDAILARQGDEASPDPGEGAVPEEKAEEALEAAGEEEGEAEGEEGEGEREEREPRRRGRRRGGRGRGGAAADESAADEQEPPEAAEDRTVEGVVELLGNGSGFVRVSPPDPSDEDVYISAGQVRRCELVSGDVVTGPVRKPRRSERYPSMVRIDTINGTPADEVAEGTRYDDLPAGFPSERLELGSDDVTMKAIEWLTPFGKGSRVTIAGPARAGKTEVLRRIAAALAPSAGEGGSLELAVVLAGVRPEEIAAWNEGPVTPLAAASFAASQDAQSQVIDNAVEQARRMAVRGADVVLLIDTLDAAGAGAARRALGSARNIVDGGSLTVVATASAPVGGETTVIALDLNLASARRYPALDLAASGVLHPELLVGEAGAEAIAKARQEAFG